MSEDFENGNIVNATDVEGKSLDEMSVEELRDMLGNGIDKAIASARGQEGGFFACAIGDSLLATSGSVQPLRYSESHDCDPLVMRSNMLRTLSARLENIDWDR